MKITLDKDENRRRHLMGVAQEQNEKLFKQFRDPREVYLIAAYQAQQCFLQMIEDGNINQAPQDLEGFYNDTKNLMQRLMQKKKLTVN